MSSSYEMNKQEENLSNPANSPSYPPNPVYPPHLSGPSGFSTHPPSYSPNQSGPQVYAPYQIPANSNVQSYYGTQPQPGIIVSTQPNVMVLPQPAYKDYFAWSIVNLIFCNLICGIVAVIFSSKTRNAVQRRDSTSAAKYSQTAFSFNITALVLGIITNICLISWIIYNSVTRNQNAPSYYSYGSYGSYGYNG